MPTCWVPNCKTRYSGSRFKNVYPNETFAHAFLFEIPSVFSPPSKNEELLRKWQRAIPRKDRILTPKDCICEGHFFPEEILRYDEVTLPNGTIHTHLRKYSQLKEGAVPSIFPSCPASLSKPVKKRKSPTGRDISLKPIKKKKISKQLVGGDEKNSTLIPDVTQVNQDQPYPPIEFLLVEVSQFEEDPLRNNEYFSVFNFDPPVGWSRCSISDTVVAFIKWTDGYIERHLVVDSCYFKPKFFLNNKLVEVKQSEELVCTSKDTLLKAINVLSEMKMCCSLEKSNNEVCQGFARPTQTKYHSCTIF